MCKNNCVSVCSSWQQWIKAILILLYTLFVLIVVPWAIVYTVKDGFTKKDQLILVGGLFVLTSVPLCIWHILQHMLHFTKPILQKPIIRILWYVVHQVRSNFGSNCISLTFKSYKTQFSLQDGSNLFSQCGKYSIVMQSISIYYIIPHCMQ